MTGWVEVAVESSPLSPRAERGEGRGESLNRSLARAWRLRGPMALWPGRGQPSPPLPVLLAPTTHGKPNSRESRPGQATVQRLILLLEKFSSQTAQERRSPSPTTGGERARG